MSMWPKCRKAIWKTLVRKYVTKNFKKWRNLVAMMMRWLDVFKPMDQLLACNTVYFLLSSGWQILKVFGQLLTALFTIWKKLNLLYAIWQIDFAINGQILFTLVLMQRNIINFKWIVSQFKRSMDRIAMEE